MIKLQKPDDRRADYYFTWLHTFNRFLTFASESLTVHLRGLQPQFHLSSCIRGDWIDLMTTSPGSCLHWLVLTSLLSWFCVCLRSWPPGVDPRSVYRSWQNRSCDSNNWPLWKWTQQQSTLAPDLWFKRLMLAWCVVLVICGTSGISKLKPTCSHARTHTHTCATCATLWTQSEQPFN